MRKLFKLRLIGFLVLSEGRNTASDLRKLFIGQLRELLLYSFNFLFEGVQFLKYLFISLLTV